MDSIKNGSIESDENREDVAYWQSMEAEMKDAGIQDSDIKLAIGAIKQLRGEETDENYDMQDGDVTEFTTVKEVIKK